MVVEDYMTCVNQERAYTDGWREALRGNKVRVGGKNLHRRGWCDGTLKLWRDDPARAEHDKALHAVKLLAQLDLYMVKA